MTGGVVQEGTVGHIRTYQRERYSIVDWEGRKTDMTLAELESPTE